MWVRWPATVRSPRNSAAATSRFVRPSATRAATRCSAAVSPSSRVRPPIRPSSPCALVDPGGRPELLEAAERRLDRFAGARASAAPAAGRCRVRAAREPGRTGSPTVLVLRDRLLQQGSGAVRRLRWAAATRPRHRVTCASTQSRPTRAASALPDVEDAHRVGDPPELEEKLRVVGGPPADARLAPTDRRGPLVGRAEPLRRRGRISAPERDESQDRHVLRRVERRTALQPA